MDEDDNEFVPRNLLKSGKKQTKNYQIYGEFGGGSDEEEEESNQPKQFIYRPVTFISSGKAILSDGLKPIKESELEAELTDEEVLRRMQEDDDLDDTEIQEEKPKSMTNDDFKNLYGTKPVPEPAEEHAKRGYTVIEAKEPKAKEKKKKNNNSSEHTHHKDEDHASFLEDSAVGNKVWSMMMKMGYDPNKGLGPKHEGIVNPIKVLPTGKNQAIIISDDHVQKTRTQKEEEEVTEPIHVSDGKRHWTKKSKKPKVVYKTAEELIKSLPSEKTQYEILDMRGPEVRKLDSMDHIGQISTTSKILPELQFNIHQLVDMTETAIRETDSKMKAERDRFKQLEKLQVDLEKTLRLQKDKLDSIRQVLDIMRTCNDRTKSSSIDLDTLLEVFSTIRHKYSMLWDTYDLGNFAIAIGRDMLIKLIDNWDQMDATFIETFLKWRKLLQKTIVNPGKQVYKTSVLSGSDEEVDDVERVTIIDTAPYLILVDSVMTKIRPKLQSWIPDQTEVIDIIDKLTPIVPRNMIQKTLERTIIPRIINNLQALDLNQIIRMHHWIHPWLPHLGTSAENLGLFDLVRQNISRSLLDWNPMDLSTSQIAHQVLLAWQDVLDISRILQNSVIPKLIHVLREEFQIDPTGQDLTPLNNVMMWLDIVSVKDIAKIMEKEFFSKWIRILYEWLTQPDANYEEILQWYSGWKSLFPEKLANEKAIRNQFKKGLDMMNQAASNQMITAHMREPTKQEKKLGKSTAIPSMPTNEPSFKDLLTDYAADMNLVFMPKGDQKIEGKQLYDFGGVTTFIENDVLFVRDVDRWKPVSLDDFLALIDEKKRKGKKF